MILLYYTILYYWAQHRSIPTFNKLKLRVVTTPLLCSQPISCHHNPNCTATQNRPRLRTHKLLLVTEAETTDLKLLECHYTATDHRPWHAHYSILS